MPSLEVVCTTTATDAVPMTTTTTTTTTMTTSTDTRTSHSDGTESDAPSQRRVSPPEAPRSAKKQQQKKVNQMTLNNFFHKGSRNSTHNSSNSSSSAKKSTMTTTSSSAAPSPTATNDDSSTTTPDAESPPSTSLFRPQHGRHVVGVEVVESVVSSVTGIPWRTGDCETTAATKAERSLSDDPVTEGDNNHKDNDNDSHGVPHVDSSPGAEEGTAPPTAEEGTDHSDPVLVVGPTTTKAPPRRTRKRKETPTVQAQVPAEETTMDSLAKVTAPPKKRPAPRKKPAVVLAMEPVEQTVPEEPLSEERLALLSKHTDMIQRCRQRSKELVLVAREGLEEEDFPMPPPEIKLDLPTDDEFPDAVVQNMAVLIEGSPLPLSELTCSLRQTLRECHGREWSEEALSNKIKLIAERKPFLDNAAIICKDDILVKYEDNSLDRLWRWELGILEILPTTVTPLVRKARMACRKLLSHSMANQKLLKSLQEADAILRENTQSTTTTATTTKLEATLLKIAKDEEKVLKFEREAEKLRLVLLAQKKKEQEVEDKKMEKERKKDEAEKKRLEKEREKQEANDAREAEKRKKLDDKEREKQEKLQKEEKKKKAVNKQKACLMSFLALQKEAKARSPHKPDSAAVASSSADSSTDFDSKRFRSLMDSQTGVNTGPLFPTLSVSAIQSRQRRTRRFPLSVYVTVMPDATAFDEQPFAELRTVHVPNKFRFLSFHEDYRPAYRGTWSKRSTIVTGKTPFAKDSTCLDYDYDSQGEWEEGDDEIGEDVDDDSKNQEDEEDDNAAKMYDYDDGFCVADEQYLDIDEDVDEETKALYRKKLQKGDAAGVSANRICIVGPAMGGLPPSEDSIPALLDGFEKDEALDLLKSHTGKKMSQDLLWLDAFAPDNIDELDPSPEPEKPTVSTSGTPNDDYTVDEMRTLASFVHHNPLNSKDKLIEELRNANPNVFDSRAKATRKLVSIAEKKKHPSGTGVYWEVNKALLTELELHEILAKTLPDAETPPPISKKRKDTEASNDPDTQGTMESSKTAKTAKLCSPSSKPRSTAEGAAGVVLKAPPCGAAAAAVVPKVALPSVGAPSITHFLQPRKKLKVTTATPPSSQPTKELGTSP